MVRRWVALGSLGCLALAPQACGERSGDPIVAVASDATIPSSGAAGQGQDGEAGAGSPSSAGAPTQDEGGLTGLCGPCVTSQACGDENDVCILHEGESFCGRDCNDGLGCPKGYACVELDNTSLWQCVPTTTCPVPAASVPTLAEIRAYLLARINAERQARDLLPLDASLCLDDVAQASALDYARTDEPFRKFVNECDPVWPNCECDWRSEAEVAVAHYGLDWTSAIEPAFSSDRFISSFADVTISDVGIGFWMSGDEAWIALSFR